MLSFVVLVPSVGLVWFMNQAVENERLAARQRLIEAYRAQLGNAQERLQENWTKVANELAATINDAPPAVVFFGAVRDDRADAIICFAANGAVTYPDAAPLPKFRRPDAGWQQAEALERTDPAAAARAFAELAAATDNAEFAARALQAQARSLVRGGDAAAALAVLNAPLQEDRFRTVQDAQGRLLLPNAELMAFELARDVDPAGAESIRTRLAARLANYDEVAMPAAQRVFLGRELQRLQPESPEPRWLAAETLAAEYVASVTLTERDAKLRGTGIPGVWQIASANQRILFLHRDENLPARLRLAMGNTGLPADLNLEFVPPGRELTNTLLSIPAGASLPGWRLALATHDAAFFDTATHARVVSYAWIVGLVVLTIVIFAALTWGLVRRQTALTQLRNDLVANVTHELKTPLASMRLLVETLLNTDQLEERTTREYLQLIATENLRLSRLIGNFLTFSRIERNKYTFDFKTVSAAEIAEGAAAAVRDRLEAPGCRFDVMLAPDLPEISGDADALVTALVNLLDNAWKYSGDEKVIALSASAHHGHVTFAVRDDGVGLSPRDTKRIFGRFQQAHHHRSTAGGGCGLGLSIVQFIVTAHDGDVTVASEPGRGSTFTIRIPVTGKVHSTT